MTGGGLHSVPWHSAIKLVESSVIALIMAHPATEAGEGAARGGISAKFVHFGRQAIGLYALMSDWRPPSALHDIALFFYFCSVPLPSASRFSGPGVLRGPHPVV